MHINDLKRKYSAIIVRSKAKPASNPNAFTEVERAILLRGAIDALLKRCNNDWSFKVWAKYRLSRIYFMDGSWLSYGTNGASIYGPGKESIAYEVRCALRLKTSAKRYTAGLES